MHCKFSQILVKLMAHIYILRFNLCAYLLYTNLDRKKSIKIEDLKEVYRTTFEARNKWQNILLELGVSSAIIVSIGVKCHDNPDDCYREGLREWLNGGEKSWGDLVNALSSPTVRHVDVSEKIKRDYIQSADTQSAETPSKCIVI